MTVLIAGCGDLGTEIGLRFAEAGHRVVGLRRSPEILPGTIEGIRCDLAHELPPVPADTGIVVMATSADGRSEEAYRSAYVDSLRNLLDAVELSGARPHRFLLISSTAVYGVDDGSWVDESTEPEPASRTAEILLEAERLLHARLPHAVVLRLGGIYGPGRTRLIDQIRNGTAEIPAAPQYTNRIHRDDAAAAVVHLTTAVDAPAPIYVGVDDEPAVQGDVFGFLAVELGMPHPLSGGSVPKRGSNKRLS
ncbi:MAG TPA: NAD-dependent epimerase/dehydratase family protein, partial [Arthrobacter sp.]|nr:NAD-dependent epimerase/dehydratase family protein [Arthrobacter sp.]